MQLRKYQAGDAVLSALILSCRKFSESIIRVTISCGSPSKVTSVRFLFPGDRVGGISADPASAKPAVVKPLAPEHYRVQFTISRDTHNNLRRAQELLRHAIPDGDPAKIFDRALTLLLAEIEKTKVAAVTKPRDDQRQRPAWAATFRRGVRREVWKRDGGQCAFVGRERRCDERGFLEFHHRQPFAAGW